MSSHLSDTTAMAALEREIQWPTYAALHDSVCVRIDDVWNFYEGVQFCFNQGEHLTAQSKRKPKCGKLQITSPEDRAALYTIKCARIPNAWQICIMIKSNHPNIVPLIEAYRDKSRLYFVYEECHVSLGQMVNTLSAQSAVPAVQQLHVAAIIRQVRPQPLYSMRC